MSGTLTDEIPVALDGERIDRVVAIMSGLSRSAVRGMIEAGDVLLDEEVVVTASLRVRKGSVVHATLSSPATVGSAPAPNPAIGFETIYSDEHLVVVDKPVGLVVHPGAGQQDGTLVSGLLARYPEMAAVGQKERPGIVHRLDRDTSGLLVCARTQLAYDHLVAQLFDHSMHREYLTLARSIPDAHQGVIDAPIGRSRRYRTRMSVSEDGRWARTHYELLESFTLPIEACLLRCRLETGRTHQIRVHLAAVGLHVLGDPVYGRPDPFEIGRPLLHAARLALRHPGDERELWFEATPPADFQGALERFRTASSSGSTD